MLDNNDYIYVFIDESYVNKNHASKHAYLPTDNVTDPKISQQSGKEYRLLLLHTITEDGTLVKLDLTSILVDDLKWKGDTCYLKNLDRKLTTDNFWVVHSHTGDYHANMNSEMCKQWVQNKSPTSNKNTQVRR